MEYDAEALWSLLTALSIGILIGIERGWKSRLQTEGSRIAGIRTFTLTGILGGTTGLLAQLTNTGVVVTAIPAFSLVIATAYYIGSRKRDDVGITTLVALLITFTLGILTAFTNHVYVLGITVVVVSLLGFKPEIHGWINKIGEDEIYAGIKLLIISVIMLPFLPDQGYGPWQAFNPYWLWWMVVLITGLSFIGYISIKHLGERTGILLTSLTGALASSTAVTLSLAQMAKRTFVTPMFMVGVVIASVIMFIRVIIEVAVVNVKLLGLLWLPLGMMISVSLLGIVWLWFSDSTRDGKEESQIKLDNPFQIKSAVQFGLFLGLVVLLAAAMQEWFGHKGIYALALVSGLMDVDAITLSLARMAKSSISDQVAVTGIILAIISNTFVKGLMFAFITSFRSSSKLLLIMFASGFAGIFSTLFL
jgi:uncharacterized membrane protein (DUF4010 family)